MTKNLIDLSRILLGKFQNTHGRPVTGRLKTPENLTEEIRDLKDLTADSLSESASGAKFIEFSSGGRRCVAIAIGLSDREKYSIEDESQGSIKSIDMPGTIYMFLANRLDVRPKNISALWVEEHIEGPANDDSGVDLSVIRGALEDVSIFTYGNPTPTRSLSGKYTANYICTFSSGIAIGSILTEGALDIIRELFLEEKLYVFEKNLFTAMKSPLAKHAFLEIYRILEFAFVLPRAVALLDKVQLSAPGINIHVIELARHCYKELGWKRVERDSIGKIFDEYAQDNYNAFQMLPASCKPFLSFTPPTTTDTVEKKSAFVAKCSEKYYSLRNQIVHQLWPDEEIVCDESDWQKLIEFTLGCISYFYKKYLTK